MHGDVGAARQPARVLGLTVCLSPEQFSTVTATRQVVYLIPLREAVTEKSAGARAENGDGPASLLRRNDFACGGPVVGVTEADELDGERAAQAPV